MNKAFFSKIQEVLLKKQKKVEEELKEIAEDDPVLSDGLAESSEPGTDSWRTDAHTKLIAIKHNLQAILIRTKKALANLKTGRYGKCENCGSTIEEERLKIMPETTLCISCSRKTSKK